MSTPFISSRRDVRHDVAPGEGTVEFIEPVEERHRQRRLSATILTISVSGMSFRIVTESFDAEAGTMLGSCKLHLGAEVICGDFSIRNRVRMGKLSEYGGLFYPHRGADEMRLMRVISRYESAGSGEPVRSDGIYVRCCSCHSACWVEWQTRRCTCGCGRELDLTASGDPMPAELLGELARQMGQHNDVDLPASHSIVSGLMTLGQAMELGHGSSPVCHVSMPEEPPEPTRRPRYDPDFENAVTLGLLSPIQAYERGKRQQFAARISERHSISLERAFDVADNRISLLAAIRLARKEENVGKKVHPPQRASFTRLASAAIALLLLVVGTSVVWKNFVLPTATADVSPEELPAISVAAAEGESANRTALLRATTVVQQDDHGKPTRVVGPDPRSVLIAACDAISPERRLEPLEVRASFPPSADSRLGLIRGAGASGILTLHLRRERSSGRWFAGDGATALEPSTPTPAIAAAVAMPAR